MNTFQLACFLAVSESLSFARAAETLNITQPAVTHQIRSLETELDVKLFRRTTRTVELTRAGMAFIGDAKTIVETAGRAKKRFAAATPQDIEPFSIGFPCYAQLFSIPGLLKELRALHPGLYPNFHVAPIQHLYRMLSEESIDVVLGYQDTEAKKHAAVYRELCKTPVFCICAPDSPLAGCDSLRAEDFRDDRLVLSTPMHAPEPLTQYQRALIDGRSSSDLYFCDSPEAVLTLAGAGFGAAVMPGFFIPPDTSLIRIPVSDIRELSIGIFYKTMQWNQILKDFMRLARELF